MAAPATTEPAAAPSVDQQPEPRAPKPEGPTAYTLLVDGKEYQLVVDGNTVHVDDETFEVQLQSADAAVRPPPAAKGQEGAPVNAQMPGKVIRLNVAVGDRVEAGQALMVVEAMKMEMPINAPVAGKVSHLAVQSGDQVATGQVLASIS